MKRGLFLAVFFILLISQASALMVSTGAVVSEVSQIVPNKPAIIDITSSNTDLTQVTISTKTTVTDISLNVNKVNIIDITSSANFKVGLPTGISYGAFEITITNLEQSNIANATINFRVNKTFLEKENATIDNINLYRKPTSDSDWVALNTTFLNEDSEYAYFSALSPGFSTFLVFVDKSKCIPAETRCFNQQIQFCLGNKTWFVQEQCQYGCTDKECNKASGILGINFGLIFYAGAIVIGWGIIIVLYALFRNIKKKKNTF